jgi:hypothetical protein
MPLPRILHEVPTGHIWFYSNGKWTRKPKEDHTSRIRLKLTEEEARAVLHSLRLTIRFRSTDTISSMSVEKKLLEKLPLKVIGGHSSCAIANVSPATVTRPAAAVSSPAAPAAVAQPASASTPTVTHTALVPTSSGQQTSLPVV